MPEDRGNGKVTEELEALSERSRSAGLSGDLLLVAGDVSGIQGYLREAAARGTDAAGRRLRFRSFTIQALSQIAARSVLLSAAVEGVPLLEAGGHLLAAVPAESSSQLPRVQQILDEECRRTTDGWARLHLAWRRLEADPKEAAEAVLASLRAAKERPLAAALIQSGAWLPEQFRLREDAEGLGGEPCSNCRMPRAPQEGTPCRECQREKAMGGDLARLRRWCFGLHLSSSWKLAGWGIQLLDEGAPLPSGAYEGTPFPQQAPDGDFDALAALSPGRDLLAYVKADGDQMGLLFRNKPLDERRQLSRRVDRFFREWLAGDQASRDLYLVYGGGDDLFFVAPWDRALETAIALRRAWETHLSPYPASLSCGVALHPPRFPLAYALDSADQALQQAKMTRDRLCLLNEALTWEQAAQVHTVYQELCRFVREDNLPRAALWSLLQHAGELAGGEEVQPPAGDEVAGGYDLRSLERYLQRRSLLLYALSRNADAKQFPRFWTWMRGWVPFAPLGRDPSTWDACLQVLRVALPLALWSLRKE